MLAFCEGLMASHHLTFFFLYTKHFSLDLLTYTIFETILSILFCLNPVLGYISDSFAICGSKKKAYLILVGVLGTFGYIVCSLNDFFIIPVAAVFAVHFLIDLTNAFRTVLIDSLCVILHNIHKYGIKNTKQKSSTSSVGLLFACRLTGKVLSNVLFGLVYNYLNAKCILKRFFHLGRNYNFRHDHRRIPNRAQIAKLNEKPRT